MVWTGTTTARAVSSVRPGARWIVPRLLLATGLLPFVLVGCGNESSTAADQDSSTACEQAWQAFAAIDDMQDSLSDAVPTLSACSSVDEWIRVGSETPGHSLIVNEGTLDNLCRYEDEAAGAPLCSG
jgi:hypothetical protein